MKKKIIVNLSFVKIRNSEIPEIMNAILAIVEKYDPVALKIAGMYNLLSELKPLLDRLSLKYNGYPNSLELKQCREFRDKLLKAILAHMSAIEKAGLPSTAQQAALALPYLKSCMNGILLENTDTKSARISRLIHGMDENESLKAAFDALGFTVYTDELTTTQLNFISGLNARIENKTERKGKKATEARDKITLAIDNLLNAIELARVEHSDIDYMPLINELNVLIDSKLTMVKTRTTRNKNSAEKTTTVALSPTTTATAI